MDQQRPLEDAPGLVLEFADEEALAEAIAVLRHYSCVCRCPHCELYSPPQWFCPRCQTKLVPLDEGPPEPS
jgi:hypothetical protein